VENSIAATATSLRYSQLSCFASEKHRDRKRGTLKLIFMNSGLPILRTTSTAVQAASIHCKCVKIIVPVPCFVSNK